MLRIRIRWIRKILASWIRIRKNLDPNPDLLFWWGSRIRIRIKIKWLLSTGENYTKLLCNHPMQPFENYAALYKLVYLFLFESMLCMHSMQSYINFFIFYSIFLCYVMQLCTSMQMIQIVFNSNGLVPSSVDLIFDFTCLGDSTRVHLL